MHQVARSAFAAFASPSSTPSDPADPYGSSVIFEEEVALVLDALGVKISSAQLSPLLWASRAKDDETSGMVPEASADCQLGFEALVCTLNLYSPPQ